MVINKVIHDPIFILMFVFHYTAYSVQTYIRNSKSISRKCDTIFVFSIVSYSVLVLYPETERQYESFVI